MWRWVSAAVAAAAVGVAIWLLVARDAGQTEARPPPIRSLLRPDTLVTAVRQADLDGDGVVEVVVASRSKLFTHFEFPAQHLDVFAFRGGVWRRIFDATREAPAGAPEARRMLDTPAVEPINRLVDNLRVVDMEGDGSAELVVAVATIGAGGGPVELWILSLQGEELRADFYESTTRGGEINVSGDRVVFEFPVYRRRDPGCCPSFFERQVIGFDEEDGSVAVLKTSRQRAGAGTAPPG